MKKVWTLFIITWILFAILAVKVAIAQTWVTANQATIAWDAVTVNSDGDPLPPGETMEYVVYLANAVTDLNKANPTEVATTSTLSQVITLNVEGQFFVGVRSVRKAGDGTVLGQSIIIWSDNPAYVLGGQTFGIRYFKSPAAPTGLRPSGG